MNDLVPIGRFSETSRLSVKALRHYDDVGLLTPAEVDAETGYRYYRLAQLREAEAIRTLRGLGMGLDAIAAVLAAPDHDASRALLESHRDRLATEARSAQERLDALDRLLADDGSAVPYEVETRRLPASLAITIRQVTELDGVERVIAESFGRLHHAIATAGTNIVGPPFIVFHDVLDETAPGELEIALPVATAFEVEPPLTLRQLEPCVAATTIHRGDYLAIAPAYHVLAGWLQGHGHRPTGPPREVYLDDPTSTPPTEVRTEVHWPFD